MMFADWIPDVLHEIELLREAPSPPEYSTIVTARRYIVNTPHDAARPKVELMNRGVRFEWKDYSATVYQFGEYLVTSPSVVIG